jgi:hypothetical protein
MHHVEKVRAGNDGADTAVNRISKSRALADRDEDGRADLLPWVGVLACLGASVVSLATAPLLLPDSYSPITDTTSESAAQAVDAAWLARLGLLLFGLGVIWLATLSVKRWGRWGTATHIGFGAAMTATATFASKSWLVDAPYVWSEDFLHSVASGLVGISFILGVLAVQFRRRQDQVGARIFDLSALAIAMGVSLAIGFWGNIDGLLQRVMFLVAYIWYASEAIRGLPTRAGPSEHRTSAATGGLPE